MFEIRWTVEGCTEQQSDGPHEVRVQVRLLYVEPAEWTCVVALHAFEKWVGGTDRENRDVQDAEIGQAVRLYADGYAQRWGIPELSPR